MLVARPVTSFLPYTLLLFSLWSTTATTGNSQTLQKKLRTSFAQNTLLQLIIELDSKSGIGFSYSPSRLPALIKGPFPEAEKTVEEWLEQILAGTGIGVQTKGTRIQLIRVSAPENQPLRPTFAFHGYLKDTAGQPVADAAIQVKGKPRGTRSDEYGYFRLESQEAGNLIIISHIGFITREIPAENSVPADIVLLPAVGQPTDTVLVSNGYRQYKTGSAAGSFAYVGPDLLNTRISTSFTDRLDGIVSGLQFINNIPAGSAGNESALAVRGRSTIYSNAKPLLVLDGFPYHGSADNLNPADILSITVLKDAAAASIWGAFSSNGVIVVLTRQGQLNQAPQTRLISNFTYLPRPNLNYIPTLSSPEYIGVEQFLFDHKYYDYSSNNYSYLSPAVEIMAASKSGTIRSTDSAMQMQRLMRTDARKQLEKFFYQPGFFQQYAVSLSGGDKRSTYYLSAGFDRNQQQLVRNSYDRFTFTINNTFHLIPRTLTLNTGAWLIQSFLRNNNNGGPLAHPYDAVEQNGEPAIVASGWRQSFKNTLKYDWNYRPLNDLYYSNNTARFNEYRTGFQLSYQPGTPLLFTLSYQYYKGQYRTDNIKSPAMYETRNLYYTYSRVQSNGTLTHAIPEGGIADMGNNTTATHNARVMGQYTFHPHPRHAFTLQTGYDLRLVSFTSNTNRLYGYTTGNGMNVPVDYSIAYPLYFGRVPQKIPYRNSSDTDQNNYLSHYASLNYTYHTWLSTMFSYRVDASNLFGTRANKRWLPLWSAGMAARLNGQFKLRASIGFSGNVNTLLSPQITASRFPDPNRFNAPIGAVTNPANPNLGWEKVRTINAGADFRLLEGRLTGSLELYRKDGKDLIGQVEQDPTAGMAEYTGNFAQMQTKGLDLTLQLLTNIHSFTWNSTLLFSYVKDKIVRIKAREETLADMITVGQLHVREGNPLYAHYSFDVKKLNNSGNPVVMYNGSESTAYTDILQSTNPANLSYSGPVNPTWFGSLRNSISWKKFTVIVTFTFKGGHVFERPGINYTALFQGQRLGVAEFSRRWQKPGDEFVTTVPGMVYTTQTQRDDIYNNSSLLIEPGDHIRAKDLLLSYELTRKQFPRLPFSSLKLYTYINNLGIVWKATHTAIDPDYVPWGMARVLPEVRTLGAGITVYF